MPKLPVNFEEILSRAHAFFEEQNKVLEPSIIIINYRVINTNAYYNCNCIMNTQYNYIVRQIKTSSRNEIRKK